MKLSLRFFTVIVLFSCPCWAFYYDGPESSTIKSVDTGNGGIFENFVEGYVKDLFTKELSTANNQNLTDCMTRLLCENICQRTVKGEIKGEPLFNSAEMLGRTEKDPLGYFFTGGDRGYEYGKRNQCQQCAIRYMNCPANQYDYTRSITDKFEKTMFKQNQNKLNNADSSSSIDKDLEI